MFIIKILQQSGISVDKVNKFTLRHTELWSTIDTTGNDYRQLYIIVDKKLKSDQMNTGIKNYLKETLWIDGPQLQVK